jgi:hypothetical protein
VISGLVDVDASERIAETHGADVEAEPPSKPGKHPVEAKQAQHGADQKEWTGKSDEPPALLSVLLDRSPKPDRRGYPR